MRIKTETINEIEINKSRFICYLSRVNNETEAKTYIKKIKKLHPKANHHCQAFIIDQDLQRSNDDHEPSGTAGLPMLQVLRQNKMEYICAVVVRYFGGILLGSGGLIRAYSKSVSATLEKAIIYKTIIYQRYKLTIDYSLTNTIEFLLKDTIIEEKEYLDMVNYQFCTIDKALYAKINEITCGKYQPILIGDVEIEKIINN